MSKSNKKKLRKTVFSLFFIALTGTSLVYVDPIKDFFATLETKETIVEPSYSYDVSNIPTYSGELYVVINNNQPNFEEKDYQTSSFETYSDLDSLGRCGAAFANIGPDLLPKEERGSIGMVKPTGWQTIKYDHIDGKYLYNRCHLIGYQLTGENANTKNLITCTRMMNTKGMLPFENQVKEYIEKTGNHVLYRVTPVFEGNNLLANGVFIEASSVEDHGEDISIYVYVYNVQDKVKINYQDGTSELSSS